MAKNTNRNQEPVAKELEAIKRLLILLLLKAGASQGEIAKTLQVDQANLSRAFPKRGIKQFGAE